PHSREAASGWTGGGPPPPSTGGTTSCSMSGKPQRRPANRQASRGGRARRRGDEGPRLDDPAVNSGTAGPSHRIARARPTRPARDVLHDRDEALAHECDGHWVGTHALARGAARGAEGSAVNARGYDSRARRSSFHRV